MTAQECIISAKERILEEWLLKIREKIPATAGHSRPALINSLPGFLEHLIRMIDHTNSTASDRDYGLLASGHGIQRGKIGNYTLRQVSFELTLLQEVIFSALIDCSVSVTVEESKIISLCFQTAAAEAGASFIEAVNEARLRSETQFTSLVQEAKEYAIFMIDPNGVILSWNTGAERMKQYTREEVVGQNYKILFGVEDQKKGHPEQNIKLALEHGRYEEIGWRKRKDGSQYWANAVLSAIYSPNGELVGFSKIVRDLSLEKRIEDELISAKESAVAASELKSIFVANVSHEIRTPLGAILGFSEILKDPDCSAENRILAAEAIDRNGGALLRLIGDILDISKIEAGKFEVETGEICVRDLVCEVSTLFEIRARDKGLALILNFDSDVPANIISDHFRLRQILGNVIGNAVKFTERGEVRIEVHRIQLREDMSGVEFVVTDSGSGLTSEQRKNLFSPFSQADSTATRKFGGTGLGLALSRRLARKLGGDISLMDFADGTGCTFRITVSDSKVLITNTKDALVRVARPPRDLAGTNVLVVDDSQDNQMLIQMLLSKRGITSDVANNGVEAVEMALGGRYDLIFMDIQMPVMDGNQAMRKLRGANYTGPIVALSAHAMNEEKAKAFDSGCDDYLIKPIEKSRLLGILEDLVAEIAEGYN
jgi:PAS domain S-box-containing protein